MAPKNIIFLIVGLIINFNLASAQIVNIEKKRSAQLDSIYWIGDVALGAALVQNSKTVVNVNGNIRLNHIRVRHNFLSLTNYNLGRVDNDDFVNDGFQHFRYTYKINKRLSWEAFTQLQYNERIQLKLRWLLGSGPRVAVLLKDKQQFYVGVMYMFEYDEETVDEDQVNIFRDHRLSNYINLHLQPFDNLEVSNTTYFQPVIGRAKDWRLSSETSLSFKITEKLHFRTIFTILYDSRAPESVPETIYSLKNALRLSF